MVEQAPDIPSGSRQEAMARCELMYIRQGTTWGCDKYLDIRLRGAKKSEYSDESSHTKRGLTADLTLGFELSGARGTFENKYKDITVRVGQRVEWEGYSIYVEEIKVWPRFMEKWFNMREYIQLRVKHIASPKMGSDAPASKPPSKAFENQ
jgi:hypothetical protein